MFDTIFKCLGLRKLSASEMRAIQLETAERELLHAEQYAEHYTHTVTMLKARIKRLGKTVKAN